MGLPDGWVTDVPDLTRGQQLRALGNGVVPAQAYAALQWIGGWTWWARHMTSMRARQVECDLLGALPGDELVGLFPGSGGVGRVWATWAERR